MSTVTTIFTALLTSDFKSALLLGPSEWKAMFVIMGFISTGWLGFAIRKALYAKGFQEVIVDIVNELGNRKKNIILT
jgi:hypothetical protein